MALTALATANTTIGPSQYADMAQALAPRFVVDSPADMQPSYASGRVTLQPGAALIAGTRVRATGSEAVTVPSVTSGTVTYTVVIRVDWAKGPSDAATLVALPTTSVNASTTPDPSRINRIPGVLYDAVVCTVERQAGYTAALGFVDYRTWGGDGGPLRVTNDALALPNMIDARAGTFISTDRGTYTKRLDDDGVWRAVGTDSNPWRLWTPTLRYYGTDPVTGKSNGTPVSLGTGGRYTGRYRIVDGMLDGYVSITTAAGNQFGTGPITFDLPLPCANWQPDVWFSGHIFMQKGTNGADRNLDWQVQAMVKAGWTRAQIFAPHSSAFGALEPHKSSTDGRANTGIPVIVGGWSVGDVYTFKVSYPVE